MRGSVEFGLVLFLAVMHSKGMSMLPYASGYAAPSCSACMLYFSFTKLQCESSST